MILFDKRFEYPILERLDLPEGRCYVSPSGQRLASVTTILSATKTQQTKDGLEKWAKRVGRPEAELIKNQAAGLGGLIHKNLERYILGQPMIFGNNLVHKMAEKMTNIVIQQGLNKVSRVFGQEVALLCDGLYAGTADLIVEIDNEIWLADFKNSMKMKKREYIDDYFIQLCAYARAHNEMFGTTINKGRIMMIARPNDLGIAEYKEFDISGDEFSKYDDMWLSKLEQFYSNK